MRDLLEKGILLAGKSSFVTDFTRNRCYVGSVCARGEFVRGCRDNGANIDTTTAMDQNGQLNWIGARNRSGGRLWVPVPLSSHQSIRGKGLSQRFLYKSYPSLWIPTGISTTYPVDKDTSGSSVVMPQIGLDRDFVKKITSEYALGPSVGHP